MCVWDGAFDQPFWERDALAVQEMRMADERYGDLGEPDLVREPYGWSVELADGRKVTVFDGEVVAEALSVGAELAVVRGIAAGKVE